MKHTGISLKQGIADFVSGVWLRPPTAQQVAALCWRQAGKGHEVLLVTTRGRGQWMVPKGWPKTDTPDADMAGVEAYEEAGARGSVNPDPVGSFHFEKRIGPGTMMECEATVYALEVSGLDLEFPESGQRQIGWFSPAEAAAKVASSELSALLTRFEP
ncbi:NUDIX hydrolase [Hyphomonas sp.]|uniref:NUDIX hydrolase n=1 Tax=Hyphomonas sp. TaxID=87 RepID=UPI003568D4CB